MLLSTTVLDYKPVTVISCYQNRENCTILLCDTIHLVPKNLEYLWKQHLCLHLFMRAGSARLIFCSKTCFTEKNLAPQRVTEFGVFYFFEHIVLNSVLSCSITLKSIGNRKYLLWIVYTHKQTKKQVPNIKSINSSLR